MIPLMEFQDRSLKGPVMKVDEFDLSFSMKVRELAAEYNIEYNPEALIVDDDTADSVFQAGMALLADIGLYHLDTHRVVKFTREEIEVIAERHRQEPGKATLGRGQDEMILSYRTSDESRPPTMNTGVGAVAGAEWFAAYVQSYVQEESIEGLGICPGIDRLGDIEPKVGTLSEIHVAFWEQEQLRLVLDRVGRPDMHLGLLSTASSTSAIMSCMCPGRREPHNTQIGIHIMPEQKVSWDRFLLAHYCHDQGIYPWQSAMSMIGALCRDAAETAIALIANLLGQLSYGHGPTGNLFASHMDGTWGTPATNWAFSAAARASERNIKVAIGAPITGINKVWRTPVGFLQSAAMATVYTASSLAYAWQAGHSGLEARLIGEIMKATAGMDRDQANELAKAILARVDERIGQVQKEVGFPAAYDLETVTPRPEFEAGLMKTKEELAGMGVPYP